MARYTLVEACYIYPTPAGAYHAVSEPNSDTETDPHRRLLRALFRLKATPPVTVTDLKKWTGINDDEQVLSVVHQAQQAGWLQGVYDPIDCHAQPPEQILPELLASLAENGKALLADSQGFHIASHGFEAKIAEELSVLSADLASLYERRYKLLRSNLKFTDCSWAIVDAAGNSKVGFWPLHIGKHRFVLTISGIPTLNQPDFVSLIWLLSLRYGL